jgi:hypothetical protein
MVVSGLTAISCRERGEKALNDIWASLLSAEQHSRFLEALVKLGIDGEPPAVTAAKYHYFSNSIGGISMQYIEETPKKVWIRYLSPWGTYPGISALLVPPSVRRTILGTWHPRNGELLGCPRLGWVATKFVSEGHPYDEGYFCEYDHDLGPEERMRVKPTERSPEFDPAKAPKLDPNAWPEERLLKGSFNYAVDYVAHTLEIMERLFGTVAASHLVESGMRTLAVQYTTELARSTGMQGNGVHAITGLFGDILRSFRNDVAIDERQDGAVLSFSRYVPFADVGSEDIRRALFAFFAMATRVLNGRISIRRERSGSDGGERWTLIDEKRWLW